LLKADILTIATDELFLPHDAKLVRYMLSSFVRLSHASVVPKRLNIRRSRKQCRTIDQGL